MRNLGEMLTTTGVVATFFAVFFAATGLYLQYRKSKNLAALNNKKKEVHKGTSPGSLVPIEQQPRLEVAGGETIVKDDAPVVEKTTNLDYVPPKKHKNNNSTKVTSSAPVFKKYTPSGADSVHVEDTDEYVWE